MEAGGDLLGRVVAGKYAVQSVIGQGAMGVVYRAKQVALDKIVALKVISDDVRDDPEFVLRFHTEARAASRLDHPNSTRVLDFGEDDGLLYIAMELLQGETLAELIAREFPIAPARVASIMSQTLSAVGAAHALKILHRDLKPENIVILKGRDDEDRIVDVVKVCDFGIAKLEGIAEPSDGAPRVTNPNDLSSLVWGKLKNATRAGVIIGTPQYMSPEQARGDKLDDRSDLYSLGVVLFEVLTRRAPFDDGTPAEVLYKHSAVEPPKPSSLYANVDRDLEAICLRVLSKDRDARYASAREMRLALRPLLGEAPMVPAPTPSVPRVHFDTPTISATAMLASPKKRTSRVWWALAIAAAGISAFAIGAWERKMRRAHASESAQVAAQPTATVAAVSSGEAMPPRVAATAPDNASIAVRETNVRAPGHRSSSRATRASLTTIETQPQPTATVEPPPVVPEPTVTAPPLVTSPPVVNTPPPPPVVTARPAIVHADPARVHVDLGPIQADRVTVTSVDSVMRHADFTGCYRTEVGEQREADGNATLVLEMDEEHVAHAQLVGGAFSTALRQCIAQRVIGARVPNADTGGASAKVTLRFLLR